MFGCDLPDPTILVIVSGYQVESSSSYHCGLGNIDTSYSQKIGERGGTNSVRDSR